MPLLQEVNVILLIFIQLLVDMSQEFSSKIIFEKNIPAIIL